MAKITQQKFAEIYGIGTSTFQKWMKDPKFPGGLDPVGVFSYVAKKKNRPKGMRTPGQVADRLEEAIGTRPKLPDLEEATDLEAEKYRKLKGEADIIEHRLMVLREEVILKASAIEAITQCLDLMMETFKMSDEQFAEECEGREAVVIIKKREDEREKIRNEVANVLEKSLG